MPKWEVTGKGFDEDGIHEELHELTSDNIEEVLKMVRTCLDGGVTFEVFDEAVGLESQELRGIPYYEVTIKEVS